MVLYRPPTQDEGFKNRGMWSHFATPVGKSVVRINGVLTLHSYPLQTELEGLTPGVDYFLGGYDYQISAGTAAELAGLGL